MNHLQGVQIPTDTDGSHVDCHADSGLGSILNATESDLGGQSRTTGFEDVRGLSDNGCSESVVGRKSRNS